ncbi:DUF1772 domain-containing protein [Actinocorallia longicatena]
MKNASLLAALLTSGLMAGLFASFAYAIMPALAGGSDRTFVETMQRINVSILNGWFMFCFLGALGFALLAAVLHWNGPARWWIVAGFALYLVMFLITSGVNVPLNDRLAAAGDPSEIHDLAAVREAFEARWVLWNVVRAVTSTAAFGCLAWALVVAGRVPAETPQALPVAIPAGR